MATHETVYEGFWTNWIDGQTHGSTLTVNKRSAALLVAFLALYVATTGTHFWQLTCWIAFQFRSSGKNPALQTDPLQTLLRNSESSTGGAYALGHAAWNWRGKPGLKDVRDTALWLHAAAVATTACFLAAGVFSSRVTNTRSDVLLRPATCGSWTKLAHPGSDYGEEIVRVSRWEGQTSVNWADSSLLTQYCTRRSQSDASTCMAPGREFVRVNATMYDECPFNGTLCLSQSLVLDSGLVDSSEHLGINTAKRDRVGFRKKLTCAPINATSSTKKYNQVNVTELWPMNMSSSSDDNILLWLEPEFDNPSRTQIYNGSLFDAIFLGTSSFDHDMKATFVQNEALWMNYHSGRTKGSGEGYAVQVQQHIPGGPEAQNPNLNRFQPTEGLARNDSSTLLMFLMNGYTYSDGAVDDPWFKTTYSEIKEHGAYGWDRFETWFADYAAIGTLACFEDDQICNTAGKQDICTPVNPYGSSLREGDLRDLLQLNPKQSALVRRLADALGKSALGDMVVELNGASMLARKRSFDSTSISLPSNQWTLELQQWFSTSLTATEMAIKQFVTGYGEPYDQYVVSPSANDAWMCHAQVIRSDVYSSFSVLGLALILIFGGLVILANFVAEPVACRFRARAQCAVGRQRLSMQWEQASLLNLHDAAFGIDFVSSTAQTRRKGQCRKTSK